MSEEDTYQALKEILPELEAKLRQNIEQEYQEELQKVQMFYKKYAEDMITKKEIEVRRETEATESHLRRELSLIQRQRQQWLSLEQNYRRTIFELTEKLKEGKPENDLSALTEIMLQNTLTEPDKPEHEMTSWRKKSKFQTNNPFKASKKDTDNSLANANANSLNKLLKQINNTEPSNEEESNEERPLRESDSKRRWKIGEKNQNCIEEDRGKRQDTLVLSPPKHQQAKPMKSSLLQPPNQNVSSKSSIFWNEQGKKKFLSMIRSIK